VLSEARRYAAPPIAVTPSGTRLVPAGLPLVGVTPEQVCTTAICPSFTVAGAVVVRLLNASPRRVDARLAPAFHATSAAEVDPLERARVDAPLVRDGDAFRIGLGPWQIVTVLIRRSGP
jgi:hypothetical protein